MMAVQNDDDPFETAAAASAREPAVTRCKTPAAAAPLMGTRTAWSALLLLRVRRPPPALADAAKRKRRGTVLGTEARALDAVFIVGRAVAARGLQG